MASQRLAVAVVVVRESGAVAAGDQVIQSLEPFKWENDGDWKSELASRGQLEMPGMAPRRAGVWTHGQ